MNQPPIFIIGCPRSGTTLLRVILDSHPHISCGPETDFLIDLPKVIARHSRRLELFGFDDAYWDMKMADFFNSFHLDYAQKRGKQRWADKTPLYTAHLDLLNRLFPEAQFLHIIRDGLDVVASHRDRWGYLTALRATRTWVKYVSMAQRLGRTVAPGRYLEVRYEELVSDPEAKLRGMFEFLDEPWDPVVLDYRQTDHDSRGEAERWAQKCRDSTGDEAAIYSGRVGFGSKQLGPVIKMIFHQFAGRLYHDLGYA